METIWICQTFENTFCCFKINVEIKFNCTKILRQTKLITERYVARSTKLLNGPSKGTYSDIHMLYVDYVDWLHYIT